MNVKEEFPILCEALTIWGIGAVDTELPLREKVARYIQGERNKVVEQMLKEAKRAFARADSIYDELGRATFRAIESPDRLRKVLTEIRDALEAALTERYRPRV